MKVFLTGGTGFIGQPLTRALLRRGWSMTALVRKLESPQARMLSKMGAHLVTGDVTGRESMRAAMAGADIVVHNWIDCSDKAHRELGWQHCSGEDVWLSLLDGEIRLLERREGQNLLQRLPPLDVVD